MTPRPRRRKVYRIRIDGLDRHAAEALYLEVRRLVKHYGGELREFRIEKRAYRLSG